MKVLANIRSLLQVRTQDEKIIAGREMEKLPSIEKAWLAIKDGRIEDFGTMDAFDAGRFTEYEFEDVSGRLVLPTWVDSHTHLVFASWREQEFADRIHGMTYEEIANRGGGILNSAAKTQKATGEELFEAAWNRLNRLIQLGTGAIEIKSGYGLSTESELKLLCVIKELKAKSPIPIKATFLGAHAIPLAYKSKVNAYVDLVINEMLPEVAANNLADYVDVFCEKGYFSVDQTIRIIEAGAKHGLKAKIHVNQFNSFGGVEACVKAGALTVDHLEEIEPADLDALLGGNTIPVALPSCSFFLGIPYTPARRIIDNGLPIALASDFNPGSTPSGNMNFIASLGCIKLGMSPHEVINATTINGAACVELQDQVGSIAKGKRANLIITNSIDSVDFIPYSFGDSSIWKVMINGKTVAQ